MEVFERKFSKCVSTLSKENSSKVASGPILTIVLFALVAILAFAVLQSKKKPTETKTSKPRKLPRSSRDDQIMIISNTDQNEIVFV